MKITPEVKAFAIEQAERRCECTGAKCRHHRAGSRCKRGLRGDQWKVFWRSEDGGLTRENIEAWCLECFDNNFEIPRESVALLCMDLVDYPRLKKTNRRQAITLKSVLRDAAEGAASRNKGRMVLDRIDDDILLEFPKGRHALHAVQLLHPSFRDLTERLKLPVPQVRGAIHYGEVTRWRNGILVGDAVDVTARAASLAPQGRVVVTGAAVPMIRIGMDLRPADDVPVDELEAVDDLWTIEL